jgi:hypothetical protein
MSVLRRMIFDLIGWQNGADQLIDDPAVGSVRGER